MLENLYDLLWVAAVILVVISRSGIVAVALIIVVVGRLIWFWGTLIGKRKQKGEIKMMQQTKKGHSFIYLFVWKGLDYLNYNESWGMEPNRT